MRTRHTRQMTSLAVALTLAVGGARLAAQTTDLFNNTNGLGVQNRPANGTVVRFAENVEVKQIITYHWNNGAGARPGSISLIQAGTGRIFGPYPARGTSGQFNAQNVNWEVDVTISLGAGTYTVRDSDPATWSQNAQSGHAGFAIVRGIKLPAFRWTPPTRSWPGTAPSTPTTPTRPTQPVQPVYRFCSPSSQATVQMAAPTAPNCFGPVGSVVSLVVRSPLSAPIGTVFFGAGTIASGIPLGVAKTPGAGFLVPVTATLKSGTGTAVNSVYSLTMPLSLCSPGSGSWRWDVYLGPGKMKDIAAFTIQGC